jgi:hypothetical protein
MRTPRRGIRHSKETTSVLDDPAFKRAVQLLSTVDELAELTLKGDLLIEEHLAEIVRRFVFHPDRLEKCQLRFPQLVELARALSLDESDNSMWTLIDALHALRNGLAHSLAEGKRRPRLDRVRRAFFQEAVDIPDMKAPKSTDDREVLMLSFVFALGFLGQFKREADRFREVVDSMDRIMNPHRHHDGGGRA